jgi:hypothetical protein
VIFTVFVVPDRVTVLVPLVNVEPAPDVSQLPDTDHEPLVRVIVPLVPPVIVTSASAMVLAFAVSVPPFGTTRLEPPEMALLFVVRVPDTVNVFVTSMAVLIEIVPLGVKL